MRCCAGWCMCRSDGSRRSWRWWFLVTGAGRVDGSGVTASRRRRRRRGSCRVGRSCWRSSRSWSMRMSIARVAANLGVAWNTASDAILAAGAELLIDGADRFDGVTTVGVDEHLWWHTRNGDKYVTVIIDLTPKRTRTGPSRLLAVVEGRSKQTIGVLARSPDHGVPGPGRDRRDGRVHRLQDRRGRNDRHHHHRDGSLSCGGPGRGQARPLPATRPAGDAGASGAFR